MGGDTMFGKSRSLIITLLCLAVLAGGCNESSPQSGTDNGTTFDTSRLPRVTGAKEIFASAATTIFTSPDSITQTADAVDKALAAGGWQKYIAPNTATTKDPTLRIMTLKKGPQALNVFITSAPAQNNNTSVSYSTLTLKTDLPFPKDASNIEYSPERPLLTLGTAEPIDKTLDFYRQELGARGWSLWSTKLDAKQPVNGPAGDVHERGGYAHYITDKDPSVALVLTLQQADAGKSKVELKQWPIAILELEHKAYLNKQKQLATPAAAASEPPVAKIEPPAAAPDKAPVADAPAQITQDVTEKATEQATEKVTEQDLEAEESGGLPVPKRHTMTDGSKSPFRRELNANLPLDLADVLGFYRRELGKLDWKEESKGAVTAPDNAVIAFSSADGPAVLKLSRKNNETIVNLVARNPDAAAKAGVIPKPGQAKLLVSNPNDVEAVLTINKQTIRAAAGAGTKGPDGPMLDLAPGNYKFTLKLPGKPAHADELEVGTDQTWGLLIGPGGALPVQVY